MSLVFGVRCTEPNTHCWGLTVKNGWIDLEHGEDWVVNSMGIVAYRGHMLLIATLSQHNDTMASDVSLNEQLARLAAESGTLP